jgi:hypothetical protein
MGAEKCYIHRSGERLMGSLLSVTTGLSAHLSKLQLLQGVEDAQATTQTELAKTIGDFEG